MSWRVRASLVAVGLSLLLFITPNANAQIINSWEGSTQGWTALQGYSVSTSAAFGVTDGATSLQVTGAAAPNYSVLLVGVDTLGLTAQLANAAQVRMHMHVPTGGDFGFFLQASMYSNNADSGFDSLDGFTYSQSPVIGSATPTLLTWIPSALLKAEWAASSDPSTEVGFLIGGGGGGTFYVDKLEIIPVPEPTSLGLIALGGLMLRRRR